MSVFFFMQKPAYLVRVMACSSYVFSSDLSPAARMPVSILTGFLGSGKTTLLKALLAHPGMNRVAVIINEFGEIGLDHTLIERVDEDAILLNSGCLCCTVRGDLQIGRAHV